MDFAFDRAAHMRERLAFVRAYAAWVRRTPNAEWSREQAILVNSFIENARNMPLSREKYLELISRRRRHDPILRDE
jgi:hypothetical protein